MVRISENYRGWKPPLDATRVVDRLLRRLPARTIAGLGLVVLTCSGRMSRHRRRELTRWRRRKVKISDCLGLYHHASRGDRPWIELFVDNITGACPPALLRLPPMQDLLVGDVLFHELGHHIHFTQRPEHVHTESVAERLQGELLRRHVVWRVWLWLPVIVPVALVTLRHRVLGFLRWLIGAGRRQPA